jgi:CBS domain-containing protein
MAPEADCLTRHCGTGRGLAPEENMPPERKRPGPQSHTQAELDHLDALLDEALGETFPASDPVAIRLEDTYVPDGGGVTPRASPTVPINIVQDSAGVPRAPTASTIYGSDVMFIERLLPAARMRLVAIADDVALIEAAKLLRADTDLVVVCDSKGVLTGVITKTDVVNRISGCGGAACLTASSSVMSRDVLACHPGDLLQDIWSRMKERGVNNVPITDQDGRPVGVLNARDALQVLLQEAEDEESLLRDYVMGIGYR